MAKDGTNRGGARPGAGRKPKALKEKLDSGNPGGRKLKTLDISVGIDEPVGADVPPPQEYLSAMQRDGQMLGAAEIYTKVYTWLAKLGCDKFVNPQMIEQYAICVARWVQCDEAVTKFGLLGKHPTSGAPIQSPFVAMSQSYMKQANIIWAEISQIVKENCSTDYSSSPQPDMMERLLRSREGF